MYPILATITAQSASTRILIQSGGQDLLIARLGSLQSAHRHALRTLLEAVALWHEAQVRVVLCVDEQCDWERTGLLDALGFGRETLHLDIDVIPAQSARRRAKRIGGLGSFARERRQMRRAVER